MDWVRHYLNQCGRWAHLKLGSEDENIHTVCTWLEKVLNGELDVARTPRGPQHSLALLMSPITRSSKVVASKEMV